MRTTTALTLKQAAEATGKSKPTILRAIQNGKLSAEKDGEGQWQIEPAELFRVFRRVTDEALHETSDVTARNADETAALRREIELLERERHHHEETIADLRRRLDQEAEERRRAQQQLAGFLTDQRQQGQEGPRREEVEALRRDLDALRQQQLANPTNKRRGLLARMFGGS